MTSSGGSNPAPTTNTTTRPTINIINLESTLSNEQTLEAFRTFLRSADGKTKFSSEVKGRFERILDLVLFCRKLFDIHKDSDKELREAMINMNRLFFDCEFSKRVAVPGQSSLRTFKTHCWEMDFRTSTIQPNISLVRPIFEDIYRKLQSKHDYWKRTYRPATTLRAVLCNIL
ncbi:unnamed protein product [Lepeophtheirus salmonis]|uniref:(salmon louse) hypothetical protein n=1 Tax=Lepeophtheirus salmonis TaxID=72036 RepID=A0A7R8CFC3_LEPSM|nr:unnamed protein product [Lepeophtheirus salmonis]CAF2799569.1 unnamed protein product [Lepeophtheirus salmonis]